MPLSLETLTVSRFRGLRDLVLADLGRINLLVGPNNTGKTSILEAVAIFCRPLDLRAWLDAVWRREALASDESFIGLVEWMFPHRRQASSPSVEGEVSISGTGPIGFHRSVRKMTAHYRPISRIRPGPPPVPSDINGADKSSYEQPGAQLRFKAVVEGRKNELVRRYSLWDGESVLLPDQRGPLSVPVATVSGVSHRVEPVQKELTEVTLDRQKHEILSLLKALDPRIQDVLVLSPKGKRAVIHVDYASSGILPLSSFGDGVRRALLIALVLHSVAGGVLLIDEIESSLHVTALGSLFSWLVKSCEKLDVQLFATTHSLEAVDAMIEVESKSLDRIVGYHLEAPKGVPQAQRMDGDLLHRLRYERGLDVRL